MSWILELAFLLVIGFVFSTLMIYGILWAGTVLFDQSGPEIPEPLQMRKENEK
jgi:hypothetical protein